MNHMPPDDLSKLENLAERLLPFTHLIPETVRAVSVDLVTRVLLGDYPRREYARDMYKEQVCLYDSVLVCAADVAAYSIGWAFEWACDIPTDSDYSRRHVGYNINVAERALTTLESDGVVPFTNAELSLS